MSDEPRVIVAFPFALYRTNIREAKVYADLLSTMNDLRYAKASVSESIRLHGDDTQHVIRRALFSASHMSYRRCFNRGAGGLGLSDLKQLTDQQREIHDYHYDQANKLIAHSVNGFEVVTVGVGLDGEKIGIGHVAARLVGLDKPDAEKWLALIGHIENDVLGPKVENARIEAFDRVQEIPIKEIMLGGLVQDAAPDRDGAGRRR